ncbi:MAG: c-type cytochrome [Lewinellaceae bacterium]|nr:c-type cytochrome [Lewinellaceae bacterium]
MKRLSVFLAFALVMFIYACGGSGDTSAADKPAPKSMIDEPAPDDGKGVGEIKEVSLNNPLKPNMVETGKAIYEMKCAACHKLSGQRVVGPGWKGVTSRRKPEWIMNMTTNVDIMLDKDPAAQALLKECLVRMPNQNLSVGDARDVLEFMYANDGQEVGN